jgi:hypothetical protein
MKVDKMSGDEMTADETTYLLFDHIEKKIFADKMIADELTFCCLNKW